MNQHTEVLRVLCIVRVLFFFCALSTTIHNHLKRLCKMHLKKEWKKSWSTSNCATTITATGTHCFTAHNLNQTEMLMPTSNNKCAEKKLQQQLWSKKKMKRVNTHTHRHIRSEKSSQQTQQLDTMKE